MSPAKRFLLLICALILPATGTALDDALTDPAARGLAIAREADRRDAGFADTTAELTMVLRNAQGDEITRAMRQKVLEMTDDGDRSIMVFDRPRDLKGTAILTHTHKVEDDDQWLFLPAVKRVKRISSSNKSGPFMGSEFAFEDLASQEVEKYSYRYLRDETLDGIACFVVERVPVDPRSGYTRQVTWIDQGEYRLLQIDYYDRKAEKLKTMRLGGYRQYLDRYWRAAEMVMVNHQTGRSTRLLYHDYQFGTGLGEGDFNKAALANVR